MLWKNLSFILPAPLWGKWKYYYSPSPDKEAKEKGNDSMKIDSKGKDESKISDFSCSIQRRQWHPTPALLPGKSHGRRSLVGCSPWGCEDRTERLPFHFSLSCIGEGNGNPLQCSCLENPRDGGAWWAAVYGVAQSRTRWKRLSSSSSSMLYYYNMSFLSLPWHM